MDCNVVGRSSAVSACVEQWHWVLALLKPLELRVVTAAMPCEWRLALNLFAQLQVESIQQDVVSWSSLISTLKWQLAMKFLRCMRPKPNIISCNSVISALEKGRQWPETLNLLQNLLQKSSCDSAQPDVISFSACISASRWQCGIQLLTQMRMCRVPLTLVSFNALIRESDKAQAWPLALALLSAPRRNVVSFGSAMSACQNALRWDQALELMASMELQRQRANAVSHNSVLSACEKGSRWQLALFLLHQMPQALLKQEQDLLLKAAFKLLLSSFKLLFKDELSFGACVSACARALQWRMALELSKGRDSQSSNAAAGACAAARQWRVALALQERCDCLGKSFLIELCAAEGHLSPLPQLLKSLEPLLTA